HAFRIGNEVRRQVAAVKLHALNHVQLGFHGLGFFNGDHAVFADFLHSFGNDAANGFIVVGGNGADLGNHVAGDRLGQAVKKAFVAVAFFVDGAADGGNGLLNAALQGHRIGAGGHSLYAFAEDGLGQNG